MKQTIISVKREVGNEAKSAKRKNKVMCCLTAAHASFGRVCPTAACSAFGNVSPIAACAAFGRICPVAVCAALIVFILWQPVVP